MQPGQALHMLFINHKLTIMKDLLAARYKVINTWPESDLPVGIILTNFAPGKWGNGERFEFEESELWFKRYPHLFQQLKWYEERTLDELMSVNWVKITTYTGYWRVGDVVKVTDYKIDTKNKRLAFYILDGTQQSIPEKCEPATLAEYEADKAKRSGRKIEQ